jgi:uncharacterized protein YbbC (DUF1343 family)
MRHGLTMGELARWFVATLKLDVDCEVITMQGWQPGRRARLRLAARRAQLDQPEPERAQPVDGARLRRHRDARGHDLSEGRGTTRPLELFGAPDIDARR